jgi:hypothetical protein
MHALQALQSCAPVMRICAALGLRLATFAAILACALAAPALLQQQADMGLNESILPRAAVERSTGPTLAGPACRSQCTAVLRDSAVLRRSLSRCADAFAASEARANALARKLLASKRGADSLVRENAELRVRLEAVPATVRALAEMVPAISPQLATASSVSSAAHTRHSGRDAYPKPPLPISGSPAKSHTRTQHDSH